MKRVLFRVLRDSRGGTAVEFAFALPVLVMVMIGILQFAIVMHASGAMRHVVGEGIRYAKVYPNATTEQVLTEARDSFAGIEAANVTELSFERGSSNGASFARMTMRYQLQPVIPFAPLPAILLSQTKTAYLPS